mmetsp:Transcript_22202/g.28381  ORF Transcript_22202/g.28381 Transcript_22202/m.28381 type:complete len:768 (+) Transcript_22202:49-2352(+)
MSSKLDIFFLLVFIGCFVAFYNTRDGKMYAGIVQSVADKGGLRRRSRATADNMGESNGEDDEEMGDENGGSEASEEEDYKEREVEMDATTKELLGIQKRLEEQLREDQDQQLVLNAELDYLRNRFKNGVMDVIKEQIKKEQFIDESPEGLKESEDFENELIAHMQTWTSTVDDVNRIAGGGRLETDSAELLKLAEDHVHWENRELKLMLKDVKLRTTETITGKMEDSPLWISEAERNNDKNEEKSSKKNDQKSAANVTNSKMYNTIRKTENKVMNYNAGSSDKKQVAVILGEKGYINRDFAVYNSVFTKNKFQIIKKKLNPATNEAHMSTKQMSSDSWTVVICLALNTDHCFTSAGMGSTSRSQRINRLQGLRAVLWDKHNFCNTLQQGVQGDPRFTDFTFLCWHFPKHYPEAKEYAKEHPDESFIVKPLTMGGGMGISVVDGEKGLAKVRKHTHLVQTYLANPHLINNRKWDMRTYVLLTSTHPLRVYFYHRGIVRFASKEYDPNAKKGGKKSQFLTNTSVNKHYTKKGNVTEITWSFANLKDYFDKDWEMNKDKPDTKSISYEELLHRIERAISIVFLSAEQEWKRYYDGRRGPLNPEVKYCSNCYQIMGVDLIVDANNHARVIEVNGQPSMALSKDSKDHYSVTKYSMINDYVKMIFNPIKVAKILEDDLSSLDNQELVSSLKQSDMEYLLDYRREKEYQGGWRSVYPNDRHEDLHSQFLDLHKVTQQRRRVHDILMALEKKGFANSDESGDEDSATTTTVTTK